MSTRKPYEAPAITGAGSLAPNGRTIAGLRAQVERESALRRAICGACPLVPLGAAHSLASYLVQLELDLELAEQVKKTGESRQ